MIFSNINGKIIPAVDAAVPADNGAFRYGYGLFETMLVQDGVIRLKQYHWERLLQGIALLGFELSKLVTTDKLEEQVLKLVAKNKLEHLCRVRLQLYAAGGGLYGLTTPQPGYIIECFPLGDDALMLNENGLVAGFVEGVQKSADVLSNLKSCNALVYAIAARQAKARQWNDALISNSSGNIIESTIANIFWIKDEKIYTPPLTEGCVSGVMRRHLMQILQGVIEQPLTGEILLDADEVFLTNAIKKIRWIGRIEDKEYGNELIKKINGQL